MIEEISTIHGNFLMKIMMKLLLFSGTETTTGSTSTTSMPGNIAGIMGAFALPVDVMGVTQVHQ